MRGSLLVLLCWWCFSSLAIWPGASSPRSPQASSPSTTARATTLTPEETEALRLGIRPAVLLEACRWETRGERVRGVEDLVPGDGGDSIGRCQVKIGTAARWFGLNAEDLTPRVRRMIRRLLRDRVVNSHVAGLEMRWCLRHRRTLEQAIFCYQGGRRKEWRGPTRGTKNVLSRIAAAELRGRR